MAYAPTLGGAQNVKFPLQFVTSTVVGTSFACTLIKQLSNDGNDTVISHGSGCFWRHNGSVYLLTARHVITGRSPFDNSIMSATGFIPQRIMVFPTRIRNNIWQRTSIAVNVDQDVPNWLQDPEFEELRTDIAALLLLEDENAEVRCINDEPDIFDDIYTLVGMECSVVGYPTTLFSDLMTPIWRRGSIASEPRLPLDGKPMFLLDAATSPGFSGAPVLRQHFGPLPINQNGEVIMKLDSIRKISFVGVYAGRLTHTHINGEVPFVFYANRINRIFEAV